MKRRLLLLFLTACLAASGTLVGVGLAAPGSQVLPDLTTLMPTNHGNVNDRWVDTFQAPGKVLYRFDTTILNPGEGALDVFRASASGPTYQAGWPTGVPPGAVTATTPVPTSNQAILKDLGTRRLFYSSLAGHNHFHMPLVASYALLNSSGQVASQSAKNDAGFCFYDSWSGDRPSYFGSSGLCRPGQPSWTGAVRMGLSPHWGDFYGSQLTDQWVDVTGITPGAYTLRATADPAGIFDESNESNNTITSPATIPGAIASPTSASTTAGTPVQIPLSGQVIGASVKSRANATCNTYLASCMRTAQAGVASFALVQAPPASQGQASISGANATFTPAAGFAGSTSFTYRAIDSRGLSGPAATVSVSVGGQPQVTVTVAPSSATVQTGAQQQFTATVTGGTGAPAWSVNGVTGGNATVGTISSSGLYTAPASVPSGAIAVRATHTASGAFGEASVTVTGAPPPPPGPRDPSRIPLADSIDGADGGPPLGPLWSTTPLWPGEYGWKRLSGQGAPSAAGWRDSYLITGASRPVGIRFRVPVLPAQNQMLFAWLASSGFNSAPTGYALRFQRGSGNAASIQIQRWNSGGATFLAGANVTLPANGWLALIADSNGVQGFVSADGQTWTSAGASTDTSLTGVLKGGLEGNDPATRVDDVYFGTLQ